MVICVFNYRNCWSLSPLLRSTFYNMIHVQWNDRHRQNWSFAELVLHIKISPKETVICADKLCTKQKNVKILLNDDL